MQDKTYSTSDTATTERQTPSARASAQELGSESGANAAMLADVAVSPDPSSPDSKPTRQQRGGAPKDNSNAVIHGLRASKLPAGCKHEETALYRFRAFVREALTALHGEVGIYHEALLQSAVRHEQRALLAARWLRKEGDKLPLAERLALLATVSNATDSRDKALKAMGLDRPASDANPWEGLYPPRLETPT